MARFNTQQSIITVTGATTLTYVLDRGTILLTGASGYTLTLSTPVPFSGTVQSIYNATGGNVTIATPVGNIVGSGFTAATSQIIPNNTTFTLTSDGTNYVVTNNEGGPISATTGTFSSTLTANGSLTATSANAVTLSPSNASVTISPTGTGTVTMTPATTGNINNVAIGASTRAGGNFTTLDANSTVGLSPSNANVAISPSGTGTVTINPAGALTINPTTASTINNTSIGATTRSSGAFTTLGANSTATFTGTIAADTTTNSQSFTTTGAGTITITSGTAGSINNMSIGATTASTGRFTTLTVTSSISANGSTGTAGQVLTSAGAGAAVFAPVRVDRTTAYNSGTRTVNGSGQVTGYTQGSYTVSNITYSNTTSAAQITSYTEVENGVTQNVAITYLANGMINTIVIS